jgi:hypothetical protein
MPKHNGKLRIYVDFKKLNIATKKDLYPLPFIDQVLNVIAGHGIYLFLHGSFGCYQIFITIEGQYIIICIIDWGSFTWI